MKINEIVVEGALGTIGGIAGAVTKGIGKGVVDAIAPGAVDKIKGAAYNYTNRVKTSSADAASGEYKQNASEIELTKDPKVKAALDKTIVAAAELARQRQAKASAAPTSSGSFNQFAKNTRVSEALDQSVIQMSDITKLLAANSAPAAGADYVARNLTNNGITVSGYNPQQGSVTANKLKDNRFLTTLLQRATRQGSISMKEIAQAVPATGQYADKAKRSAKIQEIAKYLATNGVNVNGYQLLAQPETATWDSTKSVLTVSGAGGAAEYKLYKNGTWKDVQTGETIPKNRAKELQVQYDTVTGRVAFPSGSPKTGTKPNQVKSPTTGEVITKDNDGKWYTDAGDVITDPNDLKSLERQYSLNKQNAEMARSSAAVSQM